jgi:hypothetical protein
MKPSILVIWRVGPRSFMPFRSSTVFDEFVLGVEQARAVHMQGQHLHVLEFIGCDGLNVFPVGLGGCLGVVHHERKLERLDARETACRVAGEGPDDVDHAVLGLVIELHGRSAQLHGGVALELDAAARLLLDLFHPRLVHGQPHVGLWRHEGMELERDGLLRQAAEAGRPKRDGGGRGLEQGATLDHGVLR